MRGLPGAAPRQTACGLSGRAHDGSIRHILLVAYLYPPGNAVAAHRPAGLRRAFESAGIRTTVLTSEISGSYDDDEAQQIIRAGDLRTRFSTQYQTLVGYPEGRARGSRQATLVDEVHRPRSNRGLVVPTGPRAPPQADPERPPGCHRHDVGTGVLSFARTRGERLRHSLGRRLQGPLAEGCAPPRRRSPPDRPGARATVPRRATIVTAVNEPITTDITRRHGVRAFTISNGFDRTVLAGASNEQATLDPSRFSLVYTGLLAIDADESRSSIEGETSRTFLDALTLLAEDRRFVTRLELVVAGPISDSEREVLTRGELRQGRPSARVAAARPRTRPSASLRWAPVVPMSAPASLPRRSSSTSLRSKPIFAVTEHDGVAAELLHEAGDHTVAGAGDAKSLAAALQTFVSRWTGAPYQPRPGFDLDAYEYRNLGQKLLRLVTAVRPKEPQR